MSENTSQAQVTAKIAHEITKTELVKAESGSVAKQQPNPLITKLVTKSKREEPKQSKYTRISMDLQSLRDASQALPSVTLIIMSVFVIQGLLPALRLRTGGDFIRHLQQGIESGTLNSKNLLRLAITQAGTYILEHSAWALLHNMEDKTQHRLATEMDISLMRAHLRLDISQMMDKQIRESFQRAQNTLSLKPIGLLTRQLTFFQELTSIIAETLTLASMTPRRAWIMILMSTISPLIQEIVGKLYYNHVPDNPIENPDYEEQISRAETMKSYAHSLLMRPELTVFGLKDWVVSEYQNSSAMVAEMEQPVDPNSFRNQIFDHLTNIAQTGSRAIMYLLIALKADYFETPLASLTYIEQSSQSLFKRTCNIWLRMKYMLRDLMSIQELFECMEIQPSMRAPDNPVVYESANFGNGTGMKIEVRGVSYKYPGKNDFVLKDISFVLQAGETLALLGFNGSGKSTLIKLLTRLFDPSEGDILINDVDIRNYNRDELYEKMSVLFQDYRKFVPLRISENIGIGDIENSKENNIKEAAKDAGADPFIQKLPHQYNTKLRDGTMPSMPPRRRYYPRFPFNEEEEDPSAPVDLSGGQWQRLALSRSFMRASLADLLILDEPSSTLDPEAEHNLFRYIQQVRRNKTTIYVTHRFYTVRMATKIAFLEEGRLIEWGGHDELMKIEGGKYAKLYQLQSEGFSSLVQAEEEV